jgi:hypothetical protein
MPGLLVFAVAGFAASLVDGALGMGFGPTSSSILLVSGLAPTVVSASVNLAPVGLAVAALLLLTNARELAVWAGLGASPWMWAIYLGIVALVGIAFVAWREPREVSAARATS